MHVMASAPGVALWSWHTPYAYLLACALPQWRWLLLPTRFAPTGWLDHQRPRPEQVTLVRDLAQAYGRHRLLQCVILAQTAADLDALDQLSFGGAPPWRTLGAGEGCPHRWPLPVVFASHNRAEFEDAAVPRFLATARIPLVCISDMKCASWAAAGYDRPITVIPPGLPPEYYQGDGWTGDAAHVLTVANGLRRPLFALEDWLEATRGLPARLVGEYNDGLLGAVGPTPSWAALQDEYRGARVYLSVNHWPYEDGYNLALLEAMAAGTPCVALDSRTAPLGVGTMDTGKGLGDWLRRLLLDHDEAATWGSIARQSVAQQFEWRAFCRRWRAVLEEARDG